MFASWHNAIENRFQKIVFFKKLLDRDLFFFFHTLIQHSILCQPISHLLLYMKRNELATNRYTH